MTYEECSINVLFKHSGILLSFSIFYFIISLNIELGIPNNNNEYKIEYNTYDEENSSNIIIKNKIISFNEVFKNRTDSISSSIYKIKAEKTNSKEKMDKREHNEVIYNKVNKINSIFRKIFIMYTVQLILLIFLIILYSKKQKGIVLQNNNKNKNWFYQCELEQADLIYDIGEFLIIFYTLIKGNRLSIYNNIFKLPLNINNSLKITIIIGPLLNLNIKYFFFFFFFFLLLLLLL